MNAKISINAKRVLFGGFVAGVIQFVVNGVVNGALLSSDLQSWANGMGSLIHPLSMFASMILWTLMCLIYGLGGVWIYAAIRPFYGAGSKTALFAGLSVWTLSKLATALDLLALGILPGQLVLGQLVGSFVAIVAGIYVGAWIYRQ